MLQSIERRLHTQRDNKANKLATPGERRSNAHAHNSNSTHPVCMLLWGQYCLSAALIKSLNTNFIAHSVIVYLTVGWCACGVSVCFNARAFGSYYQTIIHII